MKENEYGGESIDFAETTVVAKNINDLKMQSTDQLHFQEEMNTYLTEAFNALYQEPNPVRITKIINSIMLIGPHATSEMPIGSEVKAKFERGPGLSDVLTQEYDTKRDEVLKQREQMLAKTSNEEAVDNIPDEMADKKEEIAEESASKDEDVKKDDKKEEKKNPTPSAFPSFKTLGYGGMALLAAGAAGVFFAPALVGPLMLLAGAYAAVVVAKAVTEVVKAVVEVVKAVGKIVSLPFKLLSSLFDTVSKVVDKIVGEPEAKKETEAPKKETPEIKKENQKIDTPANKKEVNTPKLDISNYGKLPEKQTLDTSNYGRLPKQNEYQKMLPEKEAPKSLLDRAKSWVNQKLDAAKSIFQSNKQDEKSHSDAPKLNTENYGRLPEKTPISHAPALNKDYARPSNRDLEKPYGGEDLIGQNSKDARLSENPMLNKPFGEYGRVPNLKPMQPQEKPHYDEVPLNNSAYTSMPNMQSSTPESTKPNEYGRVGDLNDLKNQNQYSSMSDKKPQPPQTPENYNSMPSKDELNKAVKGLENNLGDNNPGKSNYNAIPKTKAPEERGR